MNIQKRTQDTCTCKSYGFPHRLASGKCHGAQSGPFCGDCGESAEPKSVDFGYGVTEYWGSVSTHRDVQIVSTCCEADLFEDASLTVNYEHEAAHDF